MSGERTAFKVPTEQRRALNDGILQNATVPGGHAVHGTCWACQLRNQCAPVIAWSGGDPGDRTTRNIHVNGDSGQIGTTNCKLVQPDWQKVDRKF